MKDSKDPGTTDWVDGEHDAEGIDPGPDTSGCPFEPDVGLTPRGTPMPQTIEEWKNLADLYEAALLHEKNINSGLRAQINGYKQKLAVYRREVHVKQSKD